MTQKYLNTSFTAGTSVFTDLENPKVNTAVFTASAVKANVNGNIVPMVRGSLALRQEAQTEVCGNNCPVAVVESVKIDFNVERGAKNLAALRAEVNRLFDAASETFGFTAGHVPPPQASFGV